MPYALAKLAKVALEDAVKIASWHLADVPGVGSGLFGLTPDSVKRSPQYAAAKRAYDQAFAKLRGFNADFVRRYGAEIKAERREARAMGAATLQRGR